ncbi:DUF2927 domain-containing protein [Paracoccus sp. R86501]|uniref:DUF2927 domain-containing protein n=1 Tax=Paracoccus sp. R86501 TaxID=3101711 RepID=UPI00366EFF23
MIRSALSRRVPIASGAVLLAALLMSACGRDDAAPAPLTSDRPDPRPAVQEPATPTQAELRKARAERNRAANAVQTSASAASQSQRDYYAATQRRLIAQGKMRRDRVPQDAPITAETLTRDFMAIALRDEYTRSGDALVSQSRSAPLRRWEQPVRLQLEFGPFNSDRRPRRLAVRGRKLWQPPVQRHRPSRRPDRQRRQFRRADPVRG